MEDNEDRVDDFDFKSFNEGKYKYLKQEMN